MKGESPQNVMEQSAAPSFLGKEFMHKNFNKIGYELYGEGWKTPLSRDLGVSRRTIIRWSDGSSPIPDGVWGELEKLMCQKIAIIKELLDNIR